MVLAGLAGCGPASSDKSQNLGPRASSAGESLLSKQGSSIGSTSGVEPISGRNSTSQGEKLQSQSVGTTDSKTGGRDQPPAPSIPDIPDSVAKDLASPYVDVRLRALDHWEAKKTTAPLDLVFEALEDEDEAVQAKATEIVEKRFAAEQGRERN